MYTINSKKFKTHHPVLNVMNNKNLTLPHFMTLFVATRSGFDGPGRLSKYVEVWQIYTYQHILIRDDISLTDSTCDISRPSYFNQSSLLQLYRYSTYLQISFQMVINNYDYPLSPTN